MWWLFWAFAHQKLPRKEEALLCEGDRLVGQQFLEQACKECVRMVLPLLHGLQRGTKQLLGGHLWTRCSALPELGFWWLEATRS